VVLFGRFFVVFFRKFFPLSFLCSDPFGVTCDSADEARLCTANHSLGLINAASSTVCKAGGCDFDLCCQRKQITHASRTFSRSFPNLCAFPYDSLISPSIFFSFFAY